MAWSAAARKASLEVRRRNRLARGVPSVLYHGSRVRGLKRLEPRAPTHNIFSGRQLDHADIPGIYLTSNAREASAFTRAGGFGSKQGERGQLYRVAVRLKSPLDITNSIKYHMRKGRRFGEAKHLALKKVVRGKHDSAIFRGNSLNKDEVIVFNKWRARILKGGV